MARQLGQKRIVAEVGLSDFKPLTFALSANLDSIASSNDGMIRDSSKRQRLTASLVYSQHGVTVMKQDSLSDDP